MIAKKHSILTVGTPFLNGLSQIMLQENPWTGLLFLVGIFVGSWAMGVAAVVSVVTGTLTAKLLRYDEEEINSGLYGFSAALVGVALTCLFQPTAIIWMEIVIGSAVATIVQHAFIIRKIPAFTFPFIVVTWLFLVIVHYSPGLVFAQPALIDQSANNSLGVLTRGYGQVIFQGSIWAGIIFFIAVMINSPIAAIYGLIGAAISGLVAYGLNEPVGDIYMGLLSYNAVLCAIALAGKKAKDAILAFIATVLSVLIMVQMRRMNLPALTFPFVLATWIALAIKAAKRTEQLKKLRY